ncbi:class I SAM-dependent methyltransferase [Candidatus Magnetominusculus xianensis]|uniref:Methyltransferase type 11 n=1 Tax=Candidatus Magnetominusculus xianensis TaxID=1748249 RepID=A0ABR5SJW3_9BACT|nr:methyltransferase domain-containing protein [Candidatus Magnetominusculus xianensis]KWT92846.1 methyltransferase type 11 [Candidatus Magnetominusculus xianensis]MBF0403435.1 methyltransferase domain-containing protein [Nitrospirota bacterium]
MEHRTAAYSLLSGCGLEIGALNCPAVLDKAKCTVKYLDIHDMDVSKKLFCEVDPALFVKPDFIGDININPVSEITNEDFDFIILNHVLEHVANPIRVFLHVWPAINKNGLLVLSVPDKDYTFDKDRQLTKFEHLLADYYLEVNEAADDHYTDFLIAVHPETFQTKEAFLSAVRNVRNRNEHVHVWNSTTFKEHLLKIIDMFSIGTEIVLESAAAANKIEYFVVLRKI